MSSNAETNQWITYVCANKNFKTPEHFYTNGYCFRPSENEKNNPSSKKISGQISPVHKVVIWFRRFVYYFRLTSLFFPLTQHHPITLLYACNNICIMYIGFTLYTQICIYIYVSINQPQAAGISLILLHIKYFNERNIIQI